MIVSSLIMSKCSIVSNQRSLICTRPAPFS